MKSKSKKHKKEKKQKKERRRPKDESSDESSEGEMEWVEAESTSSNPLPDKAGASLEIQSSVKQSSIPQDKSKTVAEDDWLASPFLTATTSLSDIRRRKEEEREKENEKNRTLSSVDMPGQLTKELNPYWKDGGTGLPEERSSSKQTSAPIRNISRGADGGVGWLKKSFQRAVEQAKETGRSLEAVVADRWGSMEEYERLLAEAESASRGGGQGRPRGARGPSGPPPGWQKRREDSGRCRRDDDERDSRNYRDGDFKEIDGSRQRNIDRDRESYERTDTRDRRDDRDSRLSEGSNRCHHKKDRNDRRGDRFSDYKGCRKPGEEDGRQRDNDDTRSRFKRPGDNDSDRKDRSSSRLHARDSSDMRSKFKRPGDDDDRGERRTSSSSSHHRRSDDEPRWRKGGFKKPGEMDRETDRSSLRSYSPSSSSSSSSGGWRKTGFKKPGEDNLDQTSAEKSSRDSWSSSEQGLKKSSFQEITDDERSRRRDRSSSDEDDKDDVRSSSSSSSSDEGNSKQSTNKEEEEKERSPSPVKILSDIEMNQLGAKLVKAEIMGNEAQIQKLKAQIETARQARIAHKTKLLQNKEKVEKDKGQKRGRGKEEDGKEEVILTRTDRSGQSWPLAEATAAPDSGKRKRKKNIATHGKDGERERYFADDDNVDLETMVRNEKMGSVDDHNRLLNKVASKKLALLDSEFNTLDEMFVSSAAKAESKGKSEERERAKAIAEHRRTMATLSKCPFCIENGEMKKHLIVALGLKAYLCVPETRCMSEGQCYIVPMHHSVASTALDEDVWAEIQIFRKGLTRMFEDHEMDVCFLETCMNPKKQRHMVIEVLPVPRELGEMVPIYFKKAIQESESEWSQNKKLVDTSKKDIRRSIPRGFPFFSVDFGLDGGFAHVIEDEQTFPHYFGKEVVGGLLDVEPRLWRHPPKENFENQSKRVLQLSQWWKPFDWTQKIDREKN